MRIDISIESEAILNLYSKIPMAFESNTVFDVLPLEGGLDGFSIQERSLITPFKKDYDAIKGEGPLSWPLHFNLSNWGFIVARRGNEIIGGVVIAHNTEEVRMLEGCQDLAVIWDLRVSPEYQRRGVGRKLFMASEKWAISRNSRILKIETQNNNVAACKFYSNQGCELGAINRFAYPEYPDEVQLLWFKSLLPMRGAGS